jgi:predicted RNA-binding Zn ribbon-like protein
MDKVVFVLNNTVTDSGKQVIAYMNEAIENAEQDANPTAVNSLPGMVKHYYVNVVKAKTMTESSWLRDHVNAASAVWDTIVSLKEAEEQKQAIAETAAGQTKLTEQLTTLQEALNTALARIATLEQEKKVEVAEPAKSNKKAVKSTESDTPAEEPESEE